MGAVQRHIPVRKLAEYITGELSLLKRVELESHMAGCARCTHQLVELEQHIAKLRSASDPTTMSSVIESAVRAFRSRKSRLSTLSNSLRRVLAILNFDSMGIAPAFGVRSGIPAARQLVFRAGPDEIDLRIEPQGQTWTLSGQILGQSQVSGRAVLQGAQSTQTAVLNELGEFVLMSVRAGTYGLDISLATVRIEISDIKVGS